MTLSATNGKLHELSEIHNRAVLLDHTEQEKAPSNLTLTQLKKLGSAKLGLKFDKLNPCPQCMKIYL
jgi:hypothetical protein